MLTFTGHQTPTEADVGTEWLYEAPGQTRGLQVILEALGTKQPKRVKIRHLDDVMEGTSEWVPARRLCVPWDAAAAFWATEERWSKVHSHGPSGLEYDTAWQVLAWFVDESIAEIAGNAAGGITSIESVQKLAELSGVPVAELTSHPDAFLEDGHYLVPWPITLRVVEALCVQNQIEVAQRLKRERRDLVERIIVNLEEWPAYEYLTKPEQLKEYTDLLEQQTLKAEPRRTLLLKWADVEPDSTTEAYLALQERFERLVVAVLPALPQLRARRTQKADGIEKAIREAIRDA